jgi:hypothetical protein
VASLRKQHAIVTACPSEPGAVVVRGDGLISTTEAARRLQVSRSLVNVWLAHGVLIGDQRAAGSDHWVRLTEQEAARLSGQVPCANFLKWLDGDEIPEDNNDQPIWVKLDRKDGIEIKQSKVIERGVYHSKIKDYLIIVGVTPVPPPTEWREQLREALPFSRRCNHKGRGK